VPKISVVIPAFNRSLQLTRCLSSLKQQTFRDFEVIIADDGSTDDLQLVVNQFLNSIDIVYLQLKHFGGPSRPRNEAIKVSRSKYIAFLDSDDYWHPDKLKYSYRFLEIGNDFVYHDMFLVNNGDKKKLFNKSLKFNSYRRIKNMNISKELIINGNFIPNSSVVTTRELLNMISYFSEDRTLISVEDYDAWIRISQLPTRFYRISKCLGYIESGLSDHISEMRNKRIVTNYQALIIKHNALLKPYRTKSPTLYYCLSKAYYDQNQYRKALKGFLVVLANKPKFLYFCKSIIYLIISIVKLVIISY